MRRTTGGVGAAALFVGAAHGDLGGLERLARGIRNCAVVAFRDGTGTTAPRGLYVVDDDHPFATVWQTAMGRRPAGARR
jgi:hypothetical protein